MKRSLVMMGSEGVRLRTTVLLSAHMMSLQPGETVQLKRASEPCKTVRFLGPSMISKLDPGARRQPVVQVV